MSLCKDTKNSVAYGIVNRTVIVSLRPEQCFNDYDIFYTFSFEDSNSNGYGDAMSHPYRPIDMRGDYSSAELVHKTRKNKEDKYCGVCGDRALGYNFDAISCESCKAFFRRNAPKGLVCLCLIFACKVELGFLTLFEVPLAPNWKGVCLQNTSKSLSYHLKIGD